MELQEVLENRHSVRKYTDEDVPDEALIEMVKAARLAPSGHNIQNWHFVIIKNKELIAKVMDTIKGSNEKIAQMMEKTSPESAETFRKGYSYVTRFAGRAPALAVVFTTEYRPLGYNECVVSGIDTVLVDDPRKSPSMQGLGAGIENFLLKATELGYGACWISSPNYAADDIAELLGSEIGFDRPDWFMAAILSIGVPRGPQIATKRKNLEEFYTLVK